MTPRASEMVERLRREAAAMHAAPSGTVVGETFHAANWSDKPHRVLYDAVKLLREAATLIASQAEEIERMTRDRDEARALIEWAYDTLIEINVSNYDHDDVCRLNDASVEVILGLQSAISNSPSKEADNG